MLERPSGFAFRPNRPELVAWMATDMRLTSRRAGARARLIRRSCARPPRPFPTLPSFRRRGREAAIACRWRSTATTVGERAAPAAPRSRSPSRLATCRRADLEGSPPRCPTSPTRPSTGRSRPRSPSGCPTRSPRVLRSSRWASLAAANSIIRRTSISSCCSTRRLPRRERDEPGEAAVRIGRRLVELLQQRTEDGYVARVDMRLRPSPEVTPIALPVDAAISYYESSGAAVGAGGLHPRPRRRRRPRARAAVPGRDPAVHLAPGTRLRRHRRDPRHLVRIRDHYAQGQAFGPGLRPQARPRRHPRGRVLHPGPAIDPRRPRARRCASRRRSTRWRCWRAPGGWSPRSPKGFGDAYRGCAPSSIACR